MAQRSTYAGRTQGAVHEAAHSRWVEILARFGYAAKGVVYGIIGLLAVQVALGTGGEITGSEGALHAVARQPFGEVLLWLMILGLFGYVVWRFVQSVLDVENHGTDGKGIAKRVTQAVSGVIYGSVAITAIKLVTGNGGGGSSTQTWTAKLMSQPWGVWLVGLVGVIVAGYGLRQFQKAYEKSFTRKLVMSEMSAKEKEWAVKISRFGLAARGVVFLMMGFFFVRAAWRHDPEQARGLDGALAELAGTGYGPWVLGVVALGLVAYGVYQLVVARYRRMNPGEAGAA